MRSRIGGLPRVPATFQWPHSETRPLDFLLQIELSEIARYDTGLDLPNTGSLLFFYDTEDQHWGFDPAHRSRSRVVFVEALAAADVAQMTAAPPRSRTFSQAALKFEPIMTLPDRYSVWVENEGLSEEQLDELADGYDESHDIGQIGGHPAVIQNAMELECELASGGTYVGDPEGYRSPAARVAAGEVRNWRLLLQLPSIEDQDMLWGDDGRLYFWIKKPALAARRFEECWLILQCF